MWQIKFHAVKFINFQTISLHFIYDFCTYCIHFPGCETYKMFFTKMEYHEKASVNHTPSVFFLLLKPNILNNAK